MPPKVDVRRTSIKSLIHTRAVFKGKITQSISSIRPVLDKTDSLTDNEICLLKDCRADIECWVEKIREFDEKIYDAMSDLVLDSKEDLEDTQDLTDSPLTQEISNREDYHSEIRHTYRLVNEKICKSENLNSDKSSSSSASKPKINHTKLQKLDLPKFDGNIFEFMPFWDYFQNSVMIEDSLSDVERFTYLKSCLQGPAYDAISGLSLTSANFKTACEMLERRFGSKQLIRSAHIEELLQLPTVDDNSSHTQLRPLYDKIECHLKGLQNLGFDSDTDGSVLVPIITSKLPLSVSKEIRRQCKGKWELQSILDVLLDEVENTESFYLNRLRVSDSDSKLFKKPVTNCNQNRNQPTKTMQGFYASGYAVLCNICSLEHRTSKCDKLLKLSPTDRLCLVKQNRLCTNCLGKHSIRSCTSNISCSVCGKWHHSCLHIKNFKSYMDGIQSKNSKHQQKASHKSNAHGYSSTAKPRNDHAKKSCLLQTAVANVQSTHKKGKFRILFDSGSDRSYITTRTANLLNAPVLGQEFLSFKTFGKSGVSQSGWYNIVKVSISPSFQSNIKIPVDLLAKETICSDLTPYTLSKSVTQWPQLMHLNFADSLDHEQPLTIDILIGSDLYWQFFSGQLIKCHDGPTALDSRLGWILHGPVNATTKWHISNSFFANTINMEDEMSSTSIIKTDIPENFQQIFTTVAKTQDSTAPDSGLNEQNPTNISNIALKFADYTWSDNLTSKDLRFISSIIDSLSQDNEGRYYVDWPVNSNMDKLLSNLPGCYGRLNSLVSRLSLDQQLLNIYDEGMMKYFSNGHIQMLAHNVTYTTFHIML